MAALHAMGESHEGSTTVDLLEDTFVANSTFTLPRMGGIRAVAAFGIQDGTVSGRRMRWVDDGWLVNAGMDPKMHPMR